MGFLGLLTNKHVMQEEVMSADPAWETYRVLRFGLVNSVPGGAVELAELWPKRTDITCLVFARSP
jgi:hypothetical protein